MFQTDVQTRRDRNLICLQQSRTVGRKFATLINRVHAMLNSGKLSYSLRNGLQAKGTYIATLLENNALTPSHNLTSFQQFLDLTLVQKFVEICIMTHKDNSHHVKLAKLRHIWSLC